MASGPGQVKSAGRTAQMGWAHSPFSNIHNFSNYSISFQSFKLAITKQDLPVDQNYPNLVN
jgi:hypothetical protein